MYSSKLINLGARWRYVVSAGRLPPNEKPPRTHPSDRSLGLPQGRSSQCGGEKNPAQPEIEPRSFYKLCVTLKRHTV
jgi:hypothetical protein